ncbi:PREDICTED: interferon alpha/beta receptor 2 [Dipodomys ordii]|uniref:Interferon alpha/beta receptor 2 n=1 Tax=Dipodomys ordii TaxID=10020 RepID=A0A1S3G3M2_DIPOR|nr:PREDICTED: interferon alpha/beta receptor 2 [Dipodomys ordii]
MLLNYRAPAIHSLLWCLTVYMSLMFGASHSLNGFSEESCILKMTVQNFRLILSWELKNTSVVPTHYTLQYTIMRLNFHSYRSLKFSKPPPLEAVDMVEVISIHRKKKVWNYNYDDSDSDTEVTPKTNATGYTMHGLVGLLSQDPASSIPSHESQPIDSEADESDEAEAGAELDPPTAPEPQPWQSGDSSEPYERRESLLQDPFLEDNSSSPEGSGDRIIFNVDLNSVFLRVVDKDVDEASLVSSLTEEMADPEEDADGGESTLLIASGERTQAAHLSPSSQCLWTEDALSDQSDADADMQDGYLMR